jgi:hypothetical protein
MNLDSKQFKTLSNDLRRIAPLIPLRWGHIQNNRYDDELKKYCNIFAVFSKDELENSIASFDLDHKNYYRRRWYILRCSDCDEYLFYKNEGVEHNPDRFDKRWDIRIGKIIEFDVKGTVIPRPFISSYEDVILDPSTIIKFYYDKQSRGIRYDMQNRLFIVHHSLIDSNRELYLRCAWETKDRVFKKFVENADSINFFSYGGCTASVIFIVETTLNNLESKISGLDTNLVTI